MCGSTTTTSTLCNIFITGNSIVNNFVKIISNCRNIHNLLLLLTLYHCTSAALTDAQSTPVIGGSCDLGSAEVQIGGKQTQFFLKCEPNQEYVIWTNYNLFNASFLCHFLFSLFRCFSYHYYNYDFFEVFIIVRIVSSDFLFFFFFLYSSSATLNIFFLVARKSAICLIAVIFSNYLV